MSFSLRTNPHAPSLWGVTCAQTYNYFLNNTDGLIQKLIVSSLLTGYTVSLLSPLPQIVVLLCAVVTSHSLPHAAHVYLNRIVDTMSSVMDCNAVYHISVTNFGIPYGYLRAPW